MRRSASVNMRFGAEVLALNEHAEKDTGLHLKHLMCLRCTIYCSPFSEHRVHCFPLPSWCPLPGRPLERELTAVISSRTL